MDATESGSERWGGDVDFNDWTPDPELDDRAGPRWEPTPPPRWNRKKIALTFGAGLFAALIGLGGVLAFTSFIRGDDGTIDGTGDTPVAPVAVPVSLDWYAVDGTLAYVDRITASSDGSFYALSSAPGRGFDVWPPVRAVYHSVDGETWDFAVLDGEIGAKDLAERNGILYLIGTAPSVGGFGDAPTVVVSASADAGITWDQSSLPTVAAPPQGVGDVGGTEMSLHLATSGSGLVAVVQTNFWIDFWQLVPPEALGEGRDVRPTGDGVEIIDYAVFEQLDLECAAAGGFDDSVAVEDLPEPCRQLATGEVEGAVVDTLTWEELGLAGGQPVFSEVFLSADGDSWEAIDSPFNAGRTMSGLYPLANGYVATQWSEFGGVDIWTSSDGRTWEVATGVPSFDWVIAAGTVGADDVILGSVRGSVAAAWSDGGGGWGEVAIPMMLDPAPPQSTWPSAGAVGPLGVFVVLQSDGEFGPVGPGIVHGTAADDWDWVPLDTLSTGGLGFSDWVAVGRDQVIARFVESGGQQPVNLQLIGLPEA